MPSKNVISADNQQERLKIIWWIVGFVDGEGCFSVSIFRNSTTKLGWQVFPEFVISQEAKSINVLKTIQRFFGCGKIFVNRNSRKRENHKEFLYRYCVRSKKDIEEIIIPFFQKYQLKTAKQKDFIKFVQIMNLIKQKNHLTDKGLKQIAKIVEIMNQHKPSNFLKSSETTR